MFSTWALEKKKEEILPLLMGEKENEPQQLDLKPLPVELKYAFLEENKQCPVIISSLLNAPQEDNLLQILKSNKQALGWKISDLKGINLQSAPITFIWRRSEKMLSSHRGD